MRLQDFGSGEHKRVMGVEGPPGRCMSDAEYFSKICNGFLKKIKNRIIVAYFSREFKYPALFFPAF